ncbi:glycoside hydrolase family 19 protein [Paraburkholderia kururiensis]|uniref:glycoside hydrolase family 19 protein n=1 Tax=Paraburkholderia kururiensis TaxID=984307 RepID=UPI001F44E2FE|nr:glycoside hydrolase family 19 protein [Paraburkholderia kururiensis]
MTSQPAPKKPQAPTPAPVKLKPLPFAFPFRRKGRGKSEASTQFTDEHEIYRLLAERETSGAYLVSRKGMWHGGIHVTEAGAGQSLDLDAGLRCVADGVLIAFRANKTYPISEIAAIGDGTPVQRPFSTGFALVRHTMEFPQGTKLTFYSLYMHLMSLEDYANFPKRDKPSYWQRQWQVTQHAQDKPSSGRNGQAPDPSQQGLRVRKSHPHGEIIGILPQGASVSIGKREKDWGQVTDLHGASLYPPDAGGYVEPSRAIGGWVYLGKENGGPVVEEVIPDSMFDRVIVTTNQTCTKGDPQGDGGGIPIKAGDPIGHLGRYDSLNQCTSGTRMAHIEVFCDDGIQSFLEQGRAWVNQHGPHKEDWVALGLPPEPTILRIAPGTVLYQRTQDNRFVPGADSQLRRTDAIQVYSLAELARDPKRRIPEPHPNPNPGYPVNWWHVEGVNAQGQPIDGWVCDFNFAGGRVTREFAQKWIDFECLGDTHDPAHTIFATTREWVDYASGADVADLASRSKLSPLMLKVYDTLFTRGDGKQAADELCTLAQTGRGGYPWLMQAASRLIVKHESEWANPSKWKQLIVELEKQTGPKPQHEEEQKRIEALAWWDEVKAGIPGFPASEVFHIHPIALGGNFSKSDTCACGCCLAKVFNRYRWVRHRRHYPPQTYYGPVFTGTKKLDKFIGWDDLIAKSKATEDEKAIVIAMSSNEGNMDAVQAWDWQTFSAGAMQKTVTPEGYGELPQQIWEFRNENPSLFEEIFGRCGWSVVQEEGPRIYYSSSDTENRKITGQELYDFIKKGFQEADSGFPKESKPLASIAHAMINEEYQKKQVVDFIGRLHIAIAKKPSAIVIPQMTFFHLG